MQDMRTASNWLRFIADSWAMVLIVILRRNFGSRFIDIRGLFGLILVFVFPIFFAGHDVRPLLWLLGVYILFLLRAHIETALREGKARIGRAEPVHTRYSGQSRLARIFPKLDEVKLKSTAEPAFLIVCGFCLIPFSPPLAAFLIGGAIAISMSVSAVSMYDEAKARDAFDAMIDARQHAERVRSMASGRGW